MHPVFLKNHTEEEHQVEKNVSIPAKGHQDLLHTANGPIASCILCSLCSQGQHINELRASIYPDGHQYLRLLKPSSQHSGLWPQKALYGSQPAWVFVTTKCNSWQEHSSCTFESKATGGGGGQFTFPANQICQDFQYPGQQSSVPSVWHD